MSSVPSACKTLHVSPPPREHTCDPVGVMYQGGCLTHDHGQVLGPAELSLIEISEVDYKHLQHLMEAHVAPPDLSDAGSHLATLRKDTTVMHPVMTTQAIDLSTSTDEHCLVMPGEKTPASYGEVPAFVLARVRGEDSLTEPHDSSSSSTSSQKRSRSAARVCLEKRFNTVSADTPRHFLTMLQQSAEAQEAVIHPQMHKWMKTDRANPFEVSSPLVGGVFNPVTNMCEQAGGHIPHAVEPNKHQGLVIPKSFSFNFRPDRVVTKAHYTSGSTSTEEQELVNAESNNQTATVFRKHGSTRRSKPTTGASAALDCAGESGSSSRKRGRPHMSLVQRREKHNIKERERRKRIRLYCDELNKLVPFCESNTDKVTTLQWTTAFLRYISKTYGDTFKEEFQKTFPDESGPSDQNPIHWQMVKTSSIRLAVEQ